jgi:hypothetical protein
MQVSDVRFGPVALDPSPAKPPRSRSVTPLAKKTPRIAQHPHPTAMPRRYGAGAPILPVRTARARDCRERGLPVEGTMRDEIVKIAARMACSHG